MPNIAIEKLIAAKLREGLTHPGDPENDIPPTPIVLPFTSRAGQPKEMAELLDKTAKMLSEALVSVIELDAQCDIVPRQRVAALRLAAGDDPTPNVVPVYCSRCDSSRRNPLVVLTLTDASAVMVDGPTLVGGLKQRSSGCPHGPVA